MTATKNLNAKLNQATTEVLISTLKTIFNDMSKMSLNVMIQEELENRIGEDKLDVILNDFRKNL